MKNRRDLCLLVLHWLDEVESRIPLLGWRDPCHDLRSYREESMFQMC